MYATFHLCDKESHHSSCNGSIFMLSMGEVLMKSTEDKGISTIATVVSVGGGGNWIGHGAVC